MRSRFHSQQTVLLVWGVILLLSPVYRSFASTITAPDIDRTLRVSSFPGEIQLDPLRTYTSLEAQLYTAIYEGLVTPDPVTLRPIPGIARTWQTSEGGTVYSFELRQSARFADGTRITAEHFRDTFLAHLDPENPSPFSGFLDVVQGARDYRNGRGSAADVGIIAETPQRLRVELTHPAPYFLDLLAHQSMVVVHPADLPGAQKNEDTHPIGSGPFKITTFTPEELRLSRNPHYWEYNRIDLEEILISFTDDTAAVAEDFNSGKIQWSMGNFSYLAINNPDFVMANPLFSTSFFFFNHRQPEYRDPAVRRALALLMPWEELRSEQVYFSPTSQLIPEVPGFPAVSGIEESSIEDARRLLREAGHPDGEGLPALVIRIPSGGEHRRLAELIQAAIAGNTGIPVELEIIPGAEGYYDRLDDSDYTIASITWIGDYLDPLTFLMLFISDSGINESGYDNPAYDELIERSHRADRDQRRELLAEAERMLLQEGTVWPISHTVAFHLVNTQELEGWFPTALDIHPFKFMRRIEFLPGPGITQGYQFDEP
ncbi:peptide ABC transporter substrate-binding protein [Spirochaeta africana]|uniref:ABC-type oligopeptide transport system, periplasmic component n=1 Tax=Spirochaeta africana (strain ATCC 700263 / DSM 8902 / Z-7692) TaxID=889378 RepID=H9UMD2_SPIAZ|nr:peptide ABC transporter substrate-binding protein [Spirochaeta africana]AFG38675.1 ABC-type oligopeptide transport system, periplasmic component [Spirochaeta africana DSM 8902]